jgi:DNA primase
VIYDGDAAGIKASIRGIDLLLKEGMNIKVVLLPNGEDPDSFSKSRSASEFIDYIQSNEVDFIRFKTGLLLKEAGRDPIKRAELISDIVKSIALIPHEIIKSVYTKECSQLLEVDEKLLINQINKINLTELEREFAKTQPTGAPQEPTSQTQATPDYSDAPPPDFFNDEVDNVTLPPTPAKAVRNTDLDYFEQEIALLILKYGNHKIYSYDNNEPPELTESFVCDYIQNELTMDGIELSHPVYATFLSECVQRVHTPDFKSEKYFTQHPNQEVSRFAVEMSVERYQLSKIHSKFQNLETETERLPDLVTRAIISLKDALLKQEIAQLNNSLRHATSTEDISATQQRLLFLNSVRTKLAKVLGDRIIIMR